MSASSSGEDVARWRLPKRIAFRFFFSFFLLYFPVPLIPMWRLGEVGFAFWSTVVPRVARTLFGVQTRAPMNGSGDTTWHWVQLFLIVAVSVAITVIWSVLDRRRAAYPRLYVFLRVYVRFALAVTMIMYGVSKVLPMQFQPPPLDRLLQPVGNMSPMGLLWTFMGWSPAYTIFAGAAEVLGGLLLTARRTALLGALVIAAVMTNVVMLNFSYDVPVKIYSSILLLAALFIAAPDAKRLLNLFVLNRPVDAVPLQPSIGPVWLKNAMRVARTVIVILFVVQGFQRVSAARRMRLQPEDAATPLHGIWNVDELTIDGTPHPPLLADATRWRRIIFTGTRRVTFQLMNDQRERYNAEHRPNGFTLKMSEDPLWQEFFFFTSRPARGTLLIHGIMNGRKIAATLHKVPEPEFLLNTRGFHWINETPFNR
jgi:uncharacterized membrane protein YphA (DoxX/SURF4 family)